MAFKVIFQAFRDIAFVFQSKSSIWIASHWSFFILSTYYFDALLWVLNLSVARDLSAIIFDLYQAFFFSYFFFISLGTI